MTKLYQVVFTDPTWDEPMPNPVFPTFDAAKAYLDDCLEQSVNVPAALLDPEPWAKGLYCWKLNPEMAANIGDDFGATIFEQEWGGGPTLADLPQKEA